MISRKVEIACLLFLGIVAACLRGVPDGPLDREYDGFQGGSFMLFAINYERLGVDAYGAYGVFNVDLPPEPESTPYLYPNHPPTVILLLWQSLHWFAPDGWQTAWQENRPPPPGFEFALRLPFFLLHFAMLGALWWAVRQAAGPLRALLALAVLATLPISIVYAGLVNYENAYLPFAILAAGFHVRWLRANKRRDLLLECACLFLAGTITFGPAFFVATLTFHTLFTVGFKRAFVEGASGSVAVLTPLALHGWWVKQALPEAPAEGVWARVSNLIAPAFDGSAPLFEWFQRNTTRLAHFSSTFWFAAFVCGVVVALALAATRKHRATDASERRFELGWVLFGGALLMCLAFYRHTFDGVGLYDSQTVFLINFGPGLACFAALAIERAFRTLKSRRAPALALVFAVLMGVAAQPRTMEIERLWRRPGPNDDPGGVKGPQAPLPSTNGPRLNQVIPSGSVAFVPAELGFTPATALYAWRTIVPITPTTFDQAVVRVNQQMGLKGLPRYIVLPKNPPAHARATTEAVRAQMLATTKSILAENEHYEVWDYQN